MSNIPGLRRKNKPVGVCRGKSCFDAVRVSDRNSDQDRRGRLRPQALGKEDSALGVMFATVGNLAFGNISCKSSDENFSRHLLQFSGQGRAINSRAVTRTYLIPYPLDAKESP